MKKSNYFWGAFFLLAGILIFLDHMGLTDGLDWFSILISAFMLPLIVSGIKDKNFFLIFMPLAVILTQLDDFFVRSMFSFWPTLGSSALIALGFSFIFPSSHSHESSDFSESISEDSGETVEVRTKFSGSVKYIKSDNLKSVLINSSFAGLKVYLENAVLSDNKATIDLIADFSGIELFIPSSWTVENRIECSLAGVEEKGKTTAPKSSEILTLTGRTSFSGVTIHYV